MRQIRTNEPTRYEIVAINTETQRQLLVAYAARKSLSGLIDVLMTEVGPDGEAEPRIYKLARATDTDPNTWETVGRGNGLKVVSGPWEVKYSGLTQRDRRTMGELDMSVYDA